MGLNRGMLKYSRDFHRTALCLLVLCWRGFLTSPITLIVFGWGLAQYPYLVTPDLTFSNTAAPDAVLRPLLIVLGVGGVLWVPAFWYLYAVFKGTARKTR